VEDARDAYRAALLLDPRNPAAVEGLRRLDEKLLAGKKLMTGLLAHWTLDEVKGKIAADSSGNGNHLTFVLAPAWSAGKIGGAVRFEGKGESVVSPVLKLGDAFSIS